MATIVDKKLIVETPRAFLPLLTKRRFRGAKGGRGSGKSHFFGEDLILDAISGHVRAVCAREIQNSIKDSSKQLLEDKIRKHGLERHFRITEREIVCPRTDSLIIFRGLQNHTATSIKSLEGFNRFWCDEAQGLSQRSIELTVPTFRSNSTLDFSWNPDKASDPVEKLFREGDGDPDFVCITANYYDNPWFPDELRRDMERDKRRDPDKYSHVWLGKYKQNSEARVFKNWRVLEFATPTDARFYFGADWGFSVDPTVLVRAFIGELKGGHPVATPNGECLFIDHEAYQVGCEIDNTPALFAGSDSNPVPRWSNPMGKKGIAGALSWPMTADSARPETISYMRKRGFRISPAVKGAGSVEEGIEFLKNYDIYVHPRCKHTIDELSYYSYKIDEKTQEVLPVLADKDNHVIDALRYALEGTRRSSFTLDNI